MARRYFTPDNTTGLSESDLSIMNRAARMSAIYDGVDSPQFSILSHIRTAYKPGMSAHAVFEIVADGEN